MLLTGAGRPGVYRRGGLEIFSCFGFSRSPSNFGKNESRDKPDENGERDENDFGQGPLPEVEPQRDIVQVLEQKNHEKKTNDQAYDDFGIFHVFYPHAALRIARNTTSF